MSKKILKIRKSKNEKQNSRSILFARGSPPTYKNVTESSLYRFVYRSSFSMTVVLFLLISFTLQGTHSAYAEEVLPQAEVVLVAPDTGLSDTGQNIDSVSSESSYIVAEDPAPDEEIIIEDPLSEELTAGEAISDEVVATTSEPVKNLTELTVGSSTKSQDNSVFSDESISIIVSGEGEEMTIPTNTESTVLSSTSINFNENATLILATTTPSETVQSEIVDSNLVSDSTNESTDSENIEVVSDAESEESFDIVSEEVQSLIGTSTADELISISSSDSVFTFTKDECTKLASGSFYCLEVDQNILTDALFSAPDQDGDLEIFLVRGGIQVQITNNVMDDAAPYFDSNSNSIVWHRLVADRYQIMSYDIDSEIETQLTNTSENNMEPTRQGNYIVWQRWVDGGWNIILSDGRNEKQITYTSNSNIAPYVHGSLVVWNTYNQTGEKAIEMFDIETGTYVTVDDPDGMSVSNPRMVFVYDSLHPNGDIVTRGYDILAKKFINLDTLPRELPENLPESESTGETRALIQIKPTIKDEGAKTTNVPASGDDPLLNISSTTEAVLSDTLDMTNDLIIISELGTSSVDLPPDISEFDLIIEPLNPTVSSSSNSVQIEQG